MSWVAAHRRRKFRKRCIRASSEYRYREMVEAVDEVFERAFRVQLTLDRAWRDDWPPASGFYMSGYDRARDRLRVYEERWRTRQMEPLRERRTGVLRLLYEEEGPDMSYRDWLQRRWPPLWRVSVDTFRTHLRRTRRVMRGCPRPRRANVNGGFGLIGVPA